MSANTVIAEIKAGGVEGCLGLDQIDWGGSAGKCYEFWRVEPCWGAPCNIKDTLMCLICWHFCLLCSYSKLYATSTGQMCAIVPHILCAWLLAPVAHLLTRYNLRKKAGARGNIIGDFMCGYFCCPCAFLQQIRSVSASGWNWAVPFVLPVPVASPACKLIV